jgi:putative membrane protein
MDNWLDLNVLMATLLYSGIGVVIFGIAFLVMVKMAPFSVQKEIEEDQNTALGIVMGSVIIGLAIIIAAAMGG